MPYQPPANQQQGAQQHRQDEQVDREWALERVRELDRSVDRENERIRAARAAEEAAGGPGAGNGPIVQYRTFARRRMRHERPIPSDSLATVYHQANGTLRRLTRTLTASEIVFSRPRGVYVVDCSVRFVSFQLTVPSAKEAFRFPVSVSLSWKVLDPELVVRAQLVDGSEVYRPYLEPRLARIGRKHQPENSASAEDAINEEFQRLLGSAPGSTIGMQHGTALCSCVVKVELPMGIQAHLEQEVHLDQEKRRGKLTYDIAHQHAEQGNKLAALQQDHELTMRAQRTRHYAEVLEGGAPQLLAAKLAENPHEVNDVIAMLMDKRQLDFDGARGVLTAILDRQLASRHDVRDIMSQATAVLANHLGTPTLGLGMGELPQAGAGMRAADSSGDENDDLDDDEPDDDDLDDDLDDEHD
jgi:hypothetical protein